MASDGSWMMAHKAQIVVEHGGIHGIWSTKREC